MPTVGLCLIIKLVLFIALSITLPSQDLVFEVLAERFYERLELVQQKDGTVLTTFSFEIDIEQESLNLARGEAVKEGNVRDLHLTIAYGHWDIDRWGSSEFKAPQGLEIWSTTKNRSLGQDQDKHWSALINALSYIISPGINSADMPGPWSERHSKWALSALNNKSVYNNSGDSELSTRHIYLPRYVLCTENIKNFLKLLPCKNKAGLASLINSYEIFDRAKYISLGVELGHYLADDNLDSEQLSILLTIGLVFNTDFVKGFPGNDTYWKLSSLFSNKINSMCSVANSSTVKIYGVDENVAKMLGHYDKIEHHPSGRVSATYNTEANYIDESGYFNNLGLELSHDVNWDNLPMIGELHIRVNRYLSGILSRDSGLVATIQNKSSVESKHAVYLQTLPWFVRPLLHTLEISLEKDRIKMDSKDLLGMMRYIPAGVNKTLNVLEIDLELPPDSSVTLKFNFNFIFRKHSDYYADIDRLMDLGQSVLTVYNSNSEAVRTRDLFATQKHRLFFNTLSARFPTTDFSMPYNVVLATSLFLSLCFCSIVNILIRCYKIPTSDITLKA